MCGRIVHVHVFNANCLVHLICGLDASPRLPGEVPGVLVLRAGRLCAQGRVAARGRCRQSLEFRLKVLHRVHEHAPAILGSTPPCLCVLAPHPLTQWLLIPPEAMASRCAMMATASSSSRATSSFDTNLFTWTHIPSVLGPDALVCSGSNLFQD